MYVLIRLLEHKVTDNECFLSIKFVFWLNQEIDFFFLICETWLYFGKFVGPK